MRGRLNLFQCTMLHWRSLRPYSAVHVAEVAQPLDAAALVAAIEAQLRNWGLCGLVLDAREHRYEYRGGTPRVAFTNVDPAGDAHGALEREIERQFNLPFPAGPAIDPFRFFAIATGDGFHLGLAYDHFVAGGDSAIRLLSAIVARYAGTSLAEADAAPELYPPTYRALFAREPLLLLRMLAEVPALIALGRRTFRPFYLDPTDTYNRFASFRLDRSDSERLRARARAFGVTPNDLAMTLLLRVVEPLAARRFEAKRRREIAIASIANVRADFPPRAANAFGQFLAGLRITHPFPPGTPLATLAADVGTRMAALKKGRRYLRAVVMLGPLILIWHRLEPEHRRTVYGKHHPASGVVTSIGVDRHWLAGAPAPRSYLRGVSNGPFSPLLLAVSTAGGNVSVGVTWERGALPADIAQRVEAEFRACVAAA